MLSVLVVPVPLKVPFIAPVTVMLPTASGVGSVSKVKVSCVVVVVFDSPFAVRLVNDTGSISVPEAVPDLSVTIPVSF